MDVRIKKISIINFKGIRSFQADFNALESEFRGDNATGKTSLFDAFCWCLYSKDSAGRSDSNFQIKTLDKGNNVIPRIPHEVSVTLTVDDKDVTLRKCFNEEWKKRRGSAVEQFAGHTIERFWNDVPCSEREYNEKIAEICPEEVFRLITNPLYFLSMPKKEQRAFLIKMAGDITHEDIAERYPEFKQLVIDMSGKTTEEYAKEIGARIKRIKVEMEGIPQRIDERKRDMPEAVDTKAVQAEIDALRTQAESVDAQMADATKAFTETNKHKQELIRQKSMMELQLSQRESEIRSNILKDYYNAKRTKDAITQELSGARYELSVREQKAAHIERQREEMAKKRLSLLDEWRAISARQFPTPSEDEFVCPTCGRKLDNEAIAEKITEMAEKFNVLKSMDLETNKVIGLQTKAEISRLDLELASCRNDIERLKEDIRRHECDPAFTWQDKEPDVTPYLKKDAKMKSYRQQMTSLEQEISTQPEREPDLSAFKQQKAELLEQISERTNLLLQQETRERSEQRIEELERQWQSQNAEVAELEGTQYQIDLFKHRMIDEVEGKINSMFQIVKFKMYEQQVNGGERETCEALVDGVPFSTNLNTAARINAGIDVINAISTHNGVLAPIFVDNRESITSLIPTESQIINLVKDESYKTLTKTK